MYLRKKPLRGLMLKAPSRRVGTGLKDDNHYHENMTNIKTI